MRTRAWLPALLTGLTLTVPTTAGAGRAKTRPQALKLERVVMLMRHGIRPPTKAEPLPPGYTVLAWPSWPVAPGLLTDRGAAGAKLLGVADARWLRTRGLLAAGCPAPGVLIVKASNKQRTQRTAQAWGEGFAPGCAITVDHPQEGAEDAIFHGLDDKPAAFDGARALAAAQAQLPTGGMAAETRAYRPELRTLAKVLDCQPPACPLDDESKLIAEEHDRPGLDGPLDIGSTASQSLLLEYLEGMPMDQVGWGRVTRAEIEQMLRFHPLKFKYSNRPTYIADTAAAPLAREILTGLTTPGRKVTLLAGHDTNIADLGGFYRASWKVPSYPADDVPPGGAFGFELLRDAKGDRYVRAFFRAQTMDQLRSLDATAAPYRGYVSIPGCGSAAVPTRCTLATFERLTRGRLR